MHHTKPTFLAFALSSALFASTAATQAQTAAPAASGVDISYNLGIVSDYRYRGISQSRLKPAVQGGFDAVLGGRIWARGPAQFNGLKTQAVNPRSKSTFTAATNTS